MKEDLFKLSLTILMKMLFFISGTTEAFPGILRRRARESWKGQSERYYL